MNDPDHLSPDEAQLLAKLRAATQSSAAAARGDLASSDKPSLQEAYTGFTKAMSALARPIDTQAVVQSVLGRMPEIEEPAPETEPPPAKSETIKTPTRRRRFWANPWSYAAAASIAVVAGLTWIENFSTDGSKNVEAGELAWNGYTKIDEKLNHSTSELEEVRRVPEFVVDARPIDEQINDAEFDMHALLNDMGLVPL
jgi:hypothetical protein